MIENLNVKTSKRIQFIDITLNVEKIIKSSKIKNGICYVFVPHTTAAVTINENADPSVVKDINSQLTKIIPEAAGYLHLEGNSDSHIKASLLGFSETIFIENGKLLLGTWQGIYFTEFDGPRTRKVLVKVIEN